MILFHDEWADGETATTKALRKEYGELISADSLRKRQTLHASNGLLAAFEVNSVRPKTAKHDDYTSNG